MAPPTYNSAYHHIGLKERGGATNYGFTLVPPYNMQLQREGVGSPDFGGAMDLIGSVPGLSRWTQDDFTGGAFQWQWGRDDAMFVDCTNFMPDTQGRALISCPPMYFKKAIDPDAYSNWVSDTPKRMFLQGNSIYLIFGHVIVRYRIDTDAVTTVAAPTNGTFAYGAYEPSDDMIWTVCNTSVSGDRPSIRRYKMDLTSPTYDPSYIGPKGAENLTAFGGTIHDSKVVVQIGRKLWVADPPDVNTDSINGTATWVKIGRFPGRWKDSVSYNGFLYILANDGLDSPTFHGGVYAFDGTSIFPVARFPHSFYGKCMVDYGGRIFIGGTGTDVNGGEHYAELYELTGNSLRLVRTFSPETRRTLMSSGTWPNTIDSLVVHEGLLWMCQKGARLVAYDITSDGFFGASEIQSNTDLNFPRMCGGRGRLWAFGVDDSDDTKHGIYRIAQPADESSLSAWYPTFVTSDFIYEPGLKKRWSDITVQTRYGPVQSIEYSVDAGGTWTSLTLGTEEADAGGYVRYRTASLAAVDPSRHIRFRIKLQATDAQDAVTYHRELVAFTVTFAMLDTGKRVWSLTINGSEEVERYDAELVESRVQAQDTTDFATTFDGWAINKTKLTFTDLDGSTADVQIVDYRKQLPIIAPKPSGETHPEAYYHLTLVEV